MKSFFINISSHTSKNWQKEQREAAEQYGEIADLPLPNVAAGLSEAEVAALGEETVQKAAAMEPAAVMVQGEFTLTYRIVTELLKRGMICVAACTERTARESLSEDGAVLKTSEFRFVRFRKYQL